MKFISIITIAVLTLILMAIAGSAHTDGAGTMTVYPTSVTAGSTGNNFIFTFYNQGHAFDSGSQVTITIPPSWTAPQRTNSMRKGYVSVTANGATSITYSISGRIITVNFRTTSAANKGFKINYRKVDAPTTSDNYEFNTQTKTSSGGALTDIDTQPHVHVNPASASKFMVSGFPSPTTAGDIGYFVVTAQDKYGNTATGYTGTVHFTSSDGKAVLPTDRESRFYLSDKGTHSFKATLKTTGIQWIKTNDVAIPIIKGSQTDIEVQPPTYTHIITPDPRVVGSAVTATITSTSTSGTKMQFIWKRPNGYYARTYIDATRFPSWADSINPNTDGTWKSIGNELDSRSVKLGTTETTFAVTENPEFGKLGAVLPLFAVGFIYMNYRKKLNK